MKHVTFSDKSLLMGDAAADALIRYATLLAAGGTADNVDVRAFGADGQEVTASLVLSDGVSLMAETSHTSMEEPENGPALKYLLDHIERLEHPAQTPVEQVGPETQTQEFDF